MNAVKVIIAGPRDYHDYISVLMAMHLCGFQVTEVVSGRARGVDTMGERWADEHGIPIKPFLAEWDKFGKSAGMRRNGQMANYADAAVVLWDGYGRGSGNMRQQMLDRKKPLFVYGIRGYRAGGRNGKGRRYN